MKAIGKHTNHLAWVDRILSSPRDFSDISYATQRKSQKSATCPSGNNSKKKGKVMRKKTQKEIIYEYLHANPASIAREIAAGTGIKQSSVSTVLGSLMASGLIQVSGETVGRGGVTNHYEIKPGAEMERSNQEIVYDVLLDCGQAALREVSELSGLEPRVTSNAISALRKAKKVEVVDSICANGAVAYVYRAVAQEKEEVRREEVIERIIALGGGPFGLMAAQLGATA